MAIEVVQLTAKVTADHSPINRAITDLLERLRNLESVVIGTYDSYDSASKKTAKSIEATQEQLWEDTQKGLLNQLEYESKIQGGITDAYRDALKDRLNTVKQGTSEERSIYSKLAADQIAQEKAITAARRAEIEIRNNLLKAQIMSSEAPNWRQGVRDLDTNQAMQMITQPGLYSTAEQEAASKRITQIARQEAVEQEAIARQNTLAQGAYYTQIAEAESASIKQRETAQATLAESEFASNRMSRDDYRAYLTQRTTDFADYTNEYRAAKIRLAQLDAQDDAKRVEADRVYFNERLAEANAYYKSMATAQKEADAMLAYQPGKIDFTNIKTGEDRQKTTSSMIGGIGSTLGNTAAAITAVDIASATMASRFNHNITTIANNTLMTNDDLGQMRNTVLDLGTTTGASFEDIARGYMHISNFGNNAVDTTKELTLANKEAVATGSQTEDVANALATTLHIFGANANEAAGYMDVLHHSAAAGNLTVQDFVKSAGPAFALAAEMHDKFYDAATAVSVLSKAGFDPSEAATQIKSLVSHTADPTNEATKAITALNEAYHKLAGSDPKLNLLEDFTQAGIQAKSILGVMKDLETVTGGRAGEVLSTEPALRGGIGALFLAQAQTGLNNPFVTKNGINDVQDQLNVTKALQLSNTGSETQGVFGRMFPDKNGKGGDPTQEWAALGNTIQAKFIPVGIEAAKVFISMEPQILKVADGVVDIMKAFQGLPKPIQDVITLFGAGVLLEKFTGVFSIVTKIPVAIGKMAVAFPKLIEAFRLTAGGAGTLSEALGAVGLDTAALITAGGPVTLAIAAFASFGYAIYSITNQLQQNADASKKAAKALADFHNENAKLQSDGSAGQIGASLDRVQLAKTTTQSHIARLLSYDPYVDMKGYSGPLKAEFGAELKQLAQQKEQDADLTKRWNAALKANDALNEAKWKKDGTLTPLPHRHHAKTSSTSSSDPSSGDDGSGAGSDDGPSVTAQNLADQLQLHKQILEAHKEAEAAQKKASEYYDKEMIALKRIIEYKQKGNAEDLNTNKFLDQANFDLTNGVASGNKSNLLAKAAAADQTEHEQYVDNILQAALQATQKVSSSAVDKALDATGISLDKWQQLAKLGPIMADGYTKAQEKVLAFGAIIEQVTIDLKAKKAVEDASMEDRLSLPENHVLSGAVDLAGGYEAWKNIGLPDNFIGPVGPGHHSDAQNSYLGASQTTSDNTDAKYLSDLIAKDALVNKNPLDPTMTPGQKVINDYLLSRNETITPSNSATIQGIGNEVNKQTIIDFTQELKKSTQQMNDKTTKDLMDSRLLTPGDKAVATWQESDVGQEMLKENTLSQGQLTGAINVMTDTIKKQTNLQQQIQEDTARRQQLISGSSDVLVGGLMAGINGAGSSARGSVQQQLYSYQQQMQQLLVQQQAFKNKYPNDPNDPYSTEISQVQQDINETQSKFNSMGSSISAMFTRIWQSVETGFDSMLQKIAQNYLQSQLQKWLTGAIGGGISSGPLAPTSSGGSGIGAILGGVANTLLGFGLGSSSNPMPTQQYTSGGVPLFGPGFTSGGGFHKDGSMYRLHYASQGWEVPGTPGAGDVYPAMLSPKEVVLPVALASKIKNMTDNSNSAPIINNNYSFRQNVTTPDVVGFRQSKKTQMQSMRRVIQRGV